MTDSAPTPSEETPRSVATTNNAPRRTRTPRWWLPTAIGVSVGLHLLVAVNLGRLIPDADRLAPIADSRTGGPVTVDLRPKADGNIPKAAAAPVQPAAPTAAPPPNTVQAAPAPVPDISEPQPQKVTAPAKVTPPIKRQTPSRVAEATPTKTAPTTPTSVTMPEVQSRPAPQPSVAPVAPIETITMRPTPRATGGFLPNRLEAPLPQGDLSGAPELERRPRALSPLSATPSPLPPRSMETEGRGGGSEAAGPTPTRPIVADASEPAPGVGRGSGGPEGGKGGGTGGGEGISRGAGMGNAVGGGLGISRGIPFGDKAGIANGDARGGGGMGGGPGGGSGGGRFTLGRKSGGGGAPVKIVYVLDVSGSMEEGDKMRQARSAVRKALSELRPEDSFNLILFSGEARAAYPSLRPASAFYLSNGESQIDLADAGGATNFSAAMSLALQQEGATHIFLMSDGEPTEGITDFNELRSMIRQSNGGRIHIITLALGLGETFKGVPLLKAIAEENGGKFSYINLGKG